MTPPAAVERLTALDPPVPVALRRSARARRITLRVSAADGGVHLTIPARLPLADARLFLLRQEDWLAARLAAMPRPVAVTIGTVLPIEGCAVPLVRGTGRSPQLGPAGLALPGDPARAGARASGFLKALARDRLTAAADAHAGALRRVPGRITLRDPGSRWGSCTQRGDMMFSWRLAMAPPAVLDYVAAHEAAHLVEMNHGPGFWRLVGRLCPDWERHRAWLRRDGAELHRYCF